MRLPLVIILAILLQPALVLVCDLLRCGGAGCGPAATSPGCCGGCDPGGEPAQGGCCCESAEPIGPACCGTDPADAGDTSNTVMGCCTVSLDPRVDSIGCECCPCTLCGLLALIFDQRAPKPRSEPPAPRPDMPSPLLASDSAPMSIASIRPVPQLPPLRAIGATDRLAWHCLRTI